MKRLLNAFSLKRNIRLLLFRPTTNVVALDGFRALSMLMIMVFHAFAIFAVANPKAITLPDLVEASGWAWSWVWNSDKGVDIFLVISGYLITGILLRQIDSLGHVRMSNFYMRRFLRLTPVYYAVILLYVLAGGPNVENIWANMLYINNFLPYDQQAMNWTWSLAIEEQFYVLYPLLLGIAMKRSHRPVFWLWFAYGLSFVICFAVIMSDPLIRSTPGSRIVADPSFHAHHFSVLYDNLYTRYGALVAGCIAAYYQHYHRDAVSRYFASGAGRMLGWLAFAFVVALMVVPVLTRRFDDAGIFSIVYQSAARNIFAAGIAVLILVSMETGALARGLQKIFGHPVWYPLAQLSYSMYLLHVVTITIAASVVGNAVVNYHDKYPYTPFEAIGIVFVASLVMTVLLSTLVYLLIERPIMNLRK